jgi:hypothetical protein
VFNACPFCALGEQDRRLLEVFLVSRGNTKEIERFLGVSYPTARQRVTEMLARLGLEKESPSADKHEILSRLAAGDIDVDEAAELLGEAR